MFLAQKRGKQARVHVRTHGGHLRTPPATEIVWDKAGPLTLISSHAHCSGQPCDEARRWTTLNGGIDPVESHRIIEPVSDILGSTVRTSENAASGLFHGNQSAHGKM